MIGRFAATSIISYLLFLLPYILSALTSSYMVLVIIIMSAAIASAIISGLLIRSHYSIIPPLSGSAASFLTNYLSGLFLAASSRVYFDWPYLALGLIASPALALLVAELRAERGIEREVEVAAVEEAARPEAEMAEEEVELIECPSCGRQIPSDSIYCPLCGSRVAEER
ncbi:MAG: zinc ribbon domain-containing protein [Aigarchaeota archaeon]|nr:zinc ribbon domain-containing protein [Candidatus Wolframiiraptor gerlachensis]